MANKKHLDILKRGVETWNQWRKEQSHIPPDLSGANLTHSHLGKANLSYAHLEEANLSDSYLWEVNLNYANLNKVKLNGANLSRANLREADLRSADLSDAHLSAADLSGANLSHANLEGADISYTYLEEANLSRANLRGANLSKATLIETNLMEAILTNCRIYGISVWNVQLQAASQDNLVITHPDQSTITVDNLELAQFIYLLLNNQKIRDVIDTLTSKVILILGRFTPERKVILDALRDELRKHNYSPVLFDFERPASRDITETVSTLAHLARFVIAEITEPKSIPQELSHIIPFLPSVPIVPLLQVPDREYGMFEHFVSYPWVQPVYYYHDLDELLHSLQEHIIDPAEKKVRELAIEKAKRLERP